MKYIGDEVNEIKDSDIESKLWYRAGGGSINTDIIICSLEKGVWDEVWDKAGKRVKWDGMELL